MFFLYIVDLDFIASSHAGVVCGKPSCLFKGCIRQLVAVCFYDYMRAGRLFGVEPPVISGGKIKGQLVILKIIFSDVYGEGVLIMGESGIGKSEAALELIKRGHRLVSDDVVEIRRVSDVTLVGSAPDITRHFIELRGIGIIDVKTLFGVESVKNTQSIDLVIKLEEWNRDKEYDRLGMEEEYTEFLGNKVVCHSLPIRPGRNLAVIVEAAAVNHRQKKMGYNAAQELYRRVQENMMKKREEGDE